MNTVLSSSVRM